MKFLLLLSLITSLYADVKQELLSLYKNKEYQKVCTVGLENFTRYKRDESFVSLYAFGCLHADFIDRLAVPITVLKRSKEARTNAVYFSAILMQKKLLYHALLDGYSFSNIKLPTTDFVLSKVFDAYVKLGKHKRRDFYIFKDSKDKKLTYKLYLQKDHEIARMVIEEFYNTTLLKRHIYW